MVQLLQSRFLANSKCTERDCLGSKTVIFILNACWLYILCVVLIFSLFFFLIIWEHLQKTRTTDIETRFGMKPLYIVIVIFYFALPTVSRSIFDAKICRAFKTNDANNTFRRYFLFAMEMKCDETPKDKNYSSLIDLFWVYFSLWPCLMPALLFLLLLKNINHSGQDKTHTIVRSLKLYLLRLVVWLDIDNLDDVERLEEYIAESAVILIFYSENYF